MALPLLDEGEDVTAMFSIPSAEDGDDVTSMFSVPSAEDGEDVTDSFAVKATKSGPKITPKDRSLSDQILTYGREIIDNAAEAWDVGSKQPWFDKLKRIPANLAEVSADSAAGALKMESDLEKTPMGLLYPTTALNTVIKHFTGTNPTDSKIEFMRDVSEGSRSAYGVDPKYDKGIFSQLSSGGMALVPAIGSGPLAPFTMASMMGEQGRKDAAEHNATKQQEDISFYSNAALGAVSEALMGVPALLRATKAAQIPEQTAKAFARVIAKQFVHGARREGTQGAIEQAGGNYIANTIAGYDPERGTMDGMLKAFVFESLIGAPTGAVFQGAESYESVKQTKELLAKAPTQNLVALTADPEAMKLLPYDRSYVDNELKKRGVTVPPPLPTAPAAAAAVARTQPITVDVPEVTLPALPSGRLGPPDPVVVEAEAAGAPATAAAVEASGRGIVPAAESTQMPGFMRKPVTPEPFAAPVPEPVTPKPAAVIADTAPTPETSAAGAAPLADTGAATGTATPVAAVAKAKAGSYELQQLGATSGEWKTIRKYDTQEEAKAALPKEMGWQVKYPVKSDVAEVAAPAAKAGEGGAMSMAEHTKATFDAVQAHIRAGGEVQIPGNPPRLIRNADALELRGGEIHLASGKRGGALTSEDVRSISAQAGRPIPLESISYPERAPEPAKAIAPLLNDALHEQSWQRLSDMLGGNRQAAEEISLLTGRDALDVPAVIVDLIADHTAIRKGLTPRTDPAERLKEVQALARSVINSDAPPSPERVDAIEWARMAAGQAQQNAAPYKGGQPKRYAKPTPAAPAAKAGETPAPAAAQAQGRSENPFDTSQTSRRLTELRDTKPRPTDKYFGTSGGTPEQRAANDAKIKRWNSDYRKAQKAHKDMVEKSNEWLREQAKPTPASPAPAAAPAAPQAKEPWQMTREEYHRYNSESIIADYESGGSESRGYGMTEKVKAFSDAEKADIRNDREFSDRNRRGTVESALREGKPVPAEVLADYPDLAAQSQPAAPAAVSSEIATMEAEAKELIGEAKTMKRKLNADESGGIPASIFQDIADFGAKLYRDGMDFAVWAKEMIRHLGERVRSALKELWVGMLNPKGARNLRGEIIQLRDEGGAIGAAGGRSEPKPGSKVEDGRKGEYYTRVAERDKGTLSDNAWATVRNRTTLPDTFAGDLETASAMLADDVDMRKSLERAKEMRSGVFNFSGSTDRVKAALLFLITQNAAAQRETATNPKHIAALDDVEAEAIAEFSDMMSQGGKLLNIASQLYAAMPMSPDAKVMAAEKLLARMSGGKAAEVEAKQAKDTLKAALDEHLKGMDESIRDIMRNKPKSTWDEVRQRIADEVVAKMDLATDAEKRAATDKIMADLKKRMEKVRKELLAKMTRHGKKGDKAAMDKLWKLFEMGALDDETLTKVFMEKAGVREFTPAFRDKLKAMYEGAETAPEGMPRDRILGNIAMELALANPKTFSFWWNLAMSISYGNILGAFTTIFVNNPLGSLATSLEMVAMGSLSNKGARKEIFKGAVKTWARSFGDGVTMMRDLWNTGENLQKINQFDSGLVNSPIELLAKMAEDPSYPKSFRVAAKAVSQYKWIMRSMMAADAAIRWPAREALRFTQSAAIVKDTLRPGQSLEDAVDELNYPGGRLAAVGEARAQAKKERKDGTLKTKLDERLRVIQLLQFKFNLSPESMEAAKESDKLANYGSLLNDQPQDFIGVIASTILKIAFPSNTASNLQKALSGAAQPFVRFVRTSANATRVMLDYAVGYGAFRYMTRNWPVIGAESLAGGVNLVEGRAGDTITQVRIQRAYLGIVLYAGLAAIYAAIDDDDEDPYIDFIGSGPTTPDERRRVRESGVRLNSIKIGNTYVPTNVGPLQPLAGIFAPFQRMRDNKKYPKAKDEFDNKVPELAGIAVAKGIGDAIMNQSFTRSLADLLTILNTGKTSFGEKPTEFFGKNLTQFIPGNLRGLSQLDEIVSGKKERADGFFDTAANSIAFYAPNGRATTILGNEVDAGKSIFQKAGEKVFQFTTLADDKTLQFVTKNGLSVPDRQRKINGKRQTYPEYSAYMRESGKMMRNWLETKDSETGKTGMEMLQSIPKEVPGEKGKPIDLRKKEMNKLWSEFRQVALLKQ